MDDKFPLGFPEELARAALFNGRDFAWSFENALKVLNWLSQEKIAAVDVDLFVEDAQIPAGFRLWGYGASTEQEPDENWDTFVKRSSQAAQILIEKYRSHTSPDGTRPTILSIYWVQRKKT